MDNIDRPYLSKLDNRDRKVRHNVNAIYVEHGESLVQLPKPTVSTTSHSRATSSAVVAESAQPATATAAVQWSATPAELAATSTEEAAATVARLQGCVREVPHINPPLFCRVQRPCGPSEAFEQTRRIE